MSGEEVVGGSLELQKQTTSKGFLGRKSGKGFSIDREGSKNESLNGEYFSKSEAGLLSLRPPLMKMSSTAW